MVIKKCLFCLSCLKFVETDALGYFKDVLKCGQFLCVGVANLVLQVRPWVSTTELSEDDVDVTENVI